MSFELKDFYAAADPYFASNMGKDQIKEYEFLTNIHPSHQGLRVIIYAQLNACYVFVCEIIDRRDYGYHEKYLKYDMTISTPPKLVEILTQCRECVKLPALEMRQKLSQWFCKEYNIIKLRRYMDEAFNKCNIRCTWPSITYGRALTVCIIGQPESNPYAITNRTYLMRIELAENTRTHELTARIIYQNLRIYKNVDINNLNEFLEIIQQGKELYDDQNGKRNPKLKSLVQSYNKSMLTNIESKIADLNLILSKYEANLISLSDDQNSPRWDDKNHLMSDINQLIFERDYILDQSKQADDEFA